MSAQAVLAVWTDATSDQEAQFNEWYVREHVTERVGLPGFLNARRYVAVQGEPKYFAYYEVKALDNLASDAYRERLQNPTAWTQSVMPSFRNTVRSVFRVHLNAGLGFAGYALTARWDTELANTFDSTDWNDIYDLTSDLILLPEVVAAQFWHEQKVNLGVNTAETLMRGPDATAGACVFVSALSVAALQAVQAKLQNLLDTNELSDPQFSIHQFLYALDKSELKRKGEQA